MKVSVIVCTRNRSYSIPECLESIQAAIEAALPVEAEIVVVDNNSSDDTHEVTAAWIQTARVPARLVLESREGLAAARNCGIAVAKGELIAFTDDDCRMTTGYVSDLLRYAAEDDEPVMRGGRIELGDASDLKLTIKTDSCRSRWSRKMNSARRYNLGNSMLGCNMTMSRAVIDRVGKFDERLGAGTPISSGEDIDYVLRAYAAGIAIEYVPDMTVAHYHGRKTIADAKALLKNYALGTGALYAKHIVAHPQGCLQLYWDAKGAVKDFLLQNKTQEFDFALAEKIYYSIVGAALFVKIKLRRGG